jgi:pimeloyl-ACP methyl ester carboxylesterase
MSEKWSLQSLGLVEKISMPLLMINGDEDGLAPASNIYFMLQSGKPGMRSAKVYKGSGHCAFDHQPEWGPIAFQWLAKNMKLQDI